MNRMHISTGGPVSNTGIGLIKLGIATELVCKIGDDLFGEGVIKQLSKYSTSQKLKCIQGEETSYTVVIVPEGFDRMLLLICSQYCAVAVKLITNAMNL